MFAGTVLKLTPTSIPHALLQIGITFALIYFNGTQEEGCPHAEYGELKKCSVYLKVLVRTSPTPVPSVS
jgi:hypothetical protein